MDVDAGFVPEISHGLGGEAISIFMANKTFKFESSVEKLTQSMLSATVGKNGY